MEQLYKVITDEQALKDFIEWLPDLEDNEKFYCSLFARKKYCKQLVKSSDKSQLKRFTSNKDMLFNKIKQLEVKQGAYTLKGEIAPQESLVAYINPNPRNMKKATFLLMEKSLQLIKNDNKNYNIHAEAMSAIQKSKSRSYVVDFDIDTKDIDLTPLLDIMSEECFDVLETRGGYHVLVKPKMMKENNHSKLWHKDILDAFPVDQIGDNMIPIPGTFQGGFTPKFIKIN